LRADGTYFPPNTFRLPDCPYETDISFISIQAAHIKALGGDVRMKQRVKEFVLNHDGSVKHLKMVSGETIVADEYVSAVPVDIMKRMMPKQWGVMPFFHQIQELQGIPVINIHMWFDRKLQNVDHLCFSRSPLLSVYADMSTTCKEHYDEERSMLELVFAPCSPIAGGKTNWIAKVRGFPNHHDPPLRLRILVLRRDYYDQKGAFPRTVTTTVYVIPTPDIRAAERLTLSFSLYKSNQEIVDATMVELERLFPLEIGPGSPDGVGAILRKHAVVKTPRSVYAAIPGRNKYRPSQSTPISNFTLAGDWTSQKFLGSMEGAVLAGKLAAEVVTDKAVYGASTKGLKKIMPDVIKEAATLTQKEPVGATEGESALTFGAGAVMTDVEEKELIVIDPEQMVAMDTRVTAPAR
jgi:15-cis-phytoene desaturase